MLPLVRFARAGLRVRHCGRFLLYFAGLGLGFIMIEMALLQRFTLFLGQPVYTYAVVLAGLLVCTGVGAYAAGRLRSQPWQHLRWIIPLIVVTLVGTAFLTPVVFTTALALPLVWRILLALILIAPLGVLLGMPFPTGLRIVAQEAAALVSWAWGVNSFCTVIGTVIALMLGMAFGFKAVLVLAALCYVIALAAMWRCAMPFPRAQPFPPNTQLNGRPFPATAWAEGGQFNGPPSTPRTLLHPAHL